MKQGKHYLSIVIWIFLAAIVAYFGYNLATSLYTPLTTTTAVEYEAGAGYYATGFVARDESVIRATKNLPLLDDCYVNTLNVYDILRANKLIVTREAMENIQEVYA